MNVKDFTDWSGWVKMELREAFLRTWDLSWDVKDGWGWSRSQGKWLQKGGDDHTRLQELMSQDPAPGVYGLVTQDGFSFAFCNPLLKQSLLYSQDQPVLLIIGLLSESEVAQSCPTLCDPIDCSLPGSSVHGIFQAIVLVSLKRKQHICYYWVRQQFWKVCIIPDPLGMDKIL